MAIERADRFVILDDIEWKNLRKQRPLLPPPSLTPATTREILAGICGLVGSTLLVQIFISGCSSSGNRDSDGLRLGLEGAIVFVVGIINYFGWK